MFTIGEISTLVKITPRMLRYYEKMGVILPARIDRNTGYRYYSGEQIPLLFQIAYLRDIGFGIPEIIDYIDSVGINEKKLLVSERADAIKLEILAMQNQADMLSSYLNRLENGKATFTCEEIVVKEQKPLFGITLRKEINNYNEQSEMWKQIGSNVSTEILNNPSISIYHGYTKEEKIDIEVGFLDEPGKELAPVELVASVICEGPYYLALPEGEQQCIQWIAKNGYEIIGNQRTIGHKHMMNEENQDLYMSEIQFPIRKVR